MLERTYKNEFVLWTLWTADGTTDSSTIEQFSLKLQYVDEKLEIHSLDFTGPPTAAERPCSGVSKMYSR